MVEVGGSNPPGPTKIKNPPLGGFFCFGGVGLDENRCSTNATAEAFGLPERRGDARRVKAPEAMALEDNPPGPTKRETLAIGGGFSFKGYAEGDRRQRFDNMRLQEHVDRQSAAKAPRRDEGARGKRARNNPPGPTKRGTLAIGGGNRAKP